MDKAGSAYDYPQKEIHALKVVHLFLGISVGFYFVYVLYQMMTAAPQESVVNLSELNFVYVMLGYSATVLLSALFIFPIPRGSIDADGATVIDTPSIGEFVDKYFNIHVVRLSMIEAAALFALSDLNVYGSSGAPLDLMSPFVKYPLLVLGGYILLWIIWFPTAAKFEAALNKRR